MNSTIYEATRKGEVIALMGHNRSHCIGDVCYKFARPKPTLDGNGNVNPYSATLPRFACGIAVMFRDDSFKSTQLSRDLIIDWNRKITVLETREK